MIDNATTAGQNISQLGGAGDPIPEGTRCLPCRPLLLIPTVWLPALLRGPETSLVHSVPQLSRRANPVAEAAIDG